MTDKRAIVTMITPDWTTPLAVLLHSLRTCAGWPESDFDVHVYQLGHGLSDADCRAISQAWGAPVAVHSLAELHCEHYNVSDLHPVWRTYTVKLDLLGVPLADRVIWLDADMAAIGPLPVLREALEDTGTIWQGLDIGPQGQGMNGELKALSTGVIVYTPDPARPEQIARYSQEHPRQYLYGDQQLLSWYVNEQMPWVHREIPHSNHLNTRLGGWWPELYAVERPFARLLHWGGPKPWGPQRSACVEPETWDVARDALNGVGVPF